MTPDSSKQIGPYKVIRRLGRGGMGTVYLCQHGRLGYRRAIKVLNTDGSKSALARFEKEAQVQAELDHPHLVKIEHSDLDQNERPYVVMSYVGDDAGPMDLDRYVKEHGSTLDSATTARIIRHILKGLGYAHGEGLVHRDLKPANILIEEVEDGPVAMIADFGLVHIAGEAAFRERIYKSISESISLGSAPTIPEQREPGQRAPDESGKTLKEGISPAGTSTQALIGTWSYMSPEHKQPGAQVDRRSDLYAVGLMAYRILLGHLPEGMPKWPGQVDSRLAAWDEWISRALKGPPAQRFQNAEDALAALPKVRAQKGPSRKPVGILVALLVIGVAVVGIWAVQALLTTTGEQPPPQVPSGSDSVRLATGSATEFDSLLAAGRRCTSYEQKSTGLAFIRQALEIRPVDSEAMGELQRLSGLLDLPRAWDACRPHIAQVYGSLRFRHRSPVRRIAFTSHGRNLVSCDDRNMITFWRMPTGQMTKSFRLDAEAGATCRLASDAFLAVTNHNDGNTLWDLTNVRPLRHFGNMNARAFAFSPDGRYVACGNSGSRELWDASSGDQLQRTVDTGQQFGVTAFSPDSGLVVWGNRNGLLDLWRASDGEQIGHFEGHSGAVTFAVFGPRGHYLASTGGDATLRIWDVSTGRQLWDAAGYNSLLAYSPNGSYLAACREDHVLTLLDTSDGTETLQFTLPPVSVGSISFSSDSRYIAAAAERAILVWDLLANAGVSLPEAHGGAVYAVAIGPDGCTVATGAADGVIRVWDMSTGELMQRFERHREAVWAVAFSPDGRQIASGSMDFTLKLWDVETGEELWSMDEGTYDYADTVGLAFSPDGEHILAGGQEGKLGLWDAETGAKVYSFAGHQNSVTSVAFGPDGRQVLSASWNGTSKLWDVKTGDVLRAFTLRHPILSAGFSPDGQMVLLGGFAAPIVTLWDAETGVRLRSITGLDEINAQRATLHHVAFGPDGEYIVSASEDGVLRLWDVETGDCVRTIQVPTSPSTVAFCFDGAHVVTGNKDTTAVLWRLNVDPAHRDGE